MNISMIFLFLFNSFFNSFFVGNNRTEYLEKDYNIAVYNESLGIQAKGIETDFFFNIVDEINNVLKKDIGDNWIVDDWNSVGNVWLNFYNIGWLNNQFHSKIKLYVENADTIINSKYTTTKTGSDKYWVNFTSEFKVNNEVKMINLYTQYYTERQLTSNERWSVAFKINVKYKRDQTNSLNSIDNFEIVIKNNKTIDYYSIPCLEENLRIILDDYKKSSDNFEIFQDSIAGTIEYQDDNSNWVYIKEIRNIITSFMLVLPEIDQIDNVLIFYNNGTFGHWLKYVNKNGKTLFTGSATPTDIILEDGTYNIRATSSIRYKY